MIKDKTNDDKLEEERVEFRLMRSGSDVNVVCNGSFLLQFDSNSLEVFGHKQLDESVSSDGTEDRDVTIGQSVFGTETEDGLGLSTASMIRDKDTSGKREVGGDLAVDIAKSLIIKGGDFELA